MLAIFYTVKESKLELAKEDSVKMLANIQVVWSLVQAKVAMLLSMGEPTLYRVGLGSYPISNFQ
jgi:hypothetical protein